MAYGVAVLGAGPGVSALHLPTLSRVDEAEVVHIADNGSGRAEELAAGIGARSSRGHVDALADPRVDVVVICTPPAQHAAQVQAAAAAGVRAILCEKPLGMTPEEAQSAIDACRDAGVALVVGTNHLHDAAWARAKHHLVARGEVQSIAVVTEPAPSPVSPSVGRGRPDLSDPRIAADVVRQLVLGLAMHDLPLVRDLVSHPPRVIFARPVAPIGYVLGLQCADVLVRMTAVMLPEGAEALWRVSVGSSGDRVDVDFPPSFVHAGSARVTVTDEEGRITTFPSDPEDGYVAEWRALLDLVDAGLPVEYDEMLADALFAIEVADAAAAATREMGQ